MGLLKGHGRREGSNRKHICLSFSPLRKYTEIEDYSCSSSCYWRNQKNKCNTVDLFGFFDWGKQKGITLLREHYVHLKRICRDTRFTFHFTLLSTYPFVYFVFPYYFWISLLKKRVRRKKKVFKNKNTRERSIEEGFEGKFSNNECERQAMLIA